jgi:predicted acylesterase/phospholipase RssA
VTLSGGGAYGAYQLGCLRALFEGRSPATGGRPLDPQVVTGTSAGALNAALLLSLETGTLIEAVDYLEDVWFNKIADTPESCGSGALRFRGNLLEIFDAACWKAPERVLFDLAGDSAFLTEDLGRRILNSIRSETDWEQRVLEIFNLESLISSRRFEWLIRRNVHLKALRRSPRELRIGTTNWTTGLLRVFSNSELTDEIGHRVIRGSTALPGIFPPVDIEGDLYSDGGLVMNTPLKPAIEAGATTIHVIYMDPLAHNLPVPAVPSTIQTMYRSYIVAMAAMLDRDMEVAQQINTGLKALRQQAVWNQMGWDRTGLQKPGALPAIREVVHTLGNQSRRALSADPRSYQLLTIHRYNPETSPGDAMLGLLTFGIDQIKRLVALGFKDAINHDCARNGCVIPD